MVRREHSEAGFTLAELMVAMAVLVVGLLGVVKLSSTGVQTSAFARAAGEATTLAQDEMERLRTLPADTAAGSETIDALGVAAEGAPYTRAWSLTALPDGTTQIAVTVSWNDGGDDPHEIAFRTVR